MSAIRQEDEVKVVTTRDERTDPKTSRPDLVKEVHLRIPLNIAVPIGAFIFLAIVALLFGLFLLKLPKEHAPAVALALGLNILAATTFAASRKRLSFATVVELCALVIYPVALAVILVNLGAVQPTAEAATPAAAAGDSSSAPAPVTLSASNLQFSDTELSFPAGQEVTLEFDNQDVAPHNIAIYQDDTLDKKFFVGQNTEPESTTEYKIPALEGGAYYFRCDIHPTMEGRITVK
jgi:plastocyanin